MLTALDGSCIVRHFVHWSTAGEDIKENKAEEDPNLIAEVVISAMKYRLGFRSVMARATLGFKYITKEQLWDSST